MKIQEMEYKHIEVAPVEAVINAIIASVKSTESVDVILGQREKMF